MTKTREKKAAPARKTLAAAVDKEALPYVPSPLEGVTLAPSMIVRDFTANPELNLYERVVAHPTSPPIAGKYFIFERSDGTGIVRKLLGISDTSWHVRQYNPERDDTISRMEFPTAYRIYTREFDPEKTTPVDRVVFINLGSQRNGGGE